MEEKRIKKSMVFNGFIVLFVLLGTIFMFTGFQFMNKTEELSGTGLSAFKFYTVDSNILVGIISTILLIYEIRFITNKKEIPNYVYILKLIGTVSVTLTFIITLFYLAPAFKNEFYLLYQNSNLFFHLIVPILSFISFIFLEYKPLPFYTTFLGIITMPIYGMYYTLNILTHMDNHTINNELDWYGFVKGGFLSMIVAFLIILLLTYGISYSEWKLNQRKNLQKEKNNYNISKEV